MSRPIVIAAVLVCSLLGSDLLANGASIADLDEKNGFRELKCGDPLTSDMRLKEDDGDEKYYFRQENMTIGAGQIASILYGFYKSQFHSVQLRMKGIVNSQAVLQTFEAAYGFPSRPNQFLEHYYWFGKKIALTFQQNAVTGDGYVLILCKVIQNQQDHDQETKAQKGKGDL